MTYKAVVDFRDLRAGEDYKKGDIYPHKGSADAERVKQLITPTAQRGALIAEVTEKAKTAEKVVGEPAEKKRSKKAEKKED